MCVRGVCGGGWLVGGGGAYYYYYYYYSLPLLLPLRFGGFRVLGF